MRAQLSGVGLSAMFAFLRFDLPGRVIAHGITGDGLRFRFFVILFAVVRIGCIGCILVPS